MSRIGRSARTAKERALDEIYAEIPAMRSCNGACAAACGPIYMFGMEWERVQRAKGGRVPPIKGITCPLLSSTGKCTVYTVRPFICRLWGTTLTLKCPEGCEPERWLSTQEAREIFERIQAIAGPDVAGPADSVPDLWEAFALEAREARQHLLDRLKEEIHHARVDRGSGDPEVRT